MKLAICAARPEEAWYTKDIINKQKLLPDPEIEILDSGEFFSCSSGQRHDYDYDIAVLWVGSGDPVPDGLRLGRRLNLKCPECAIVYVYEEGGYTSDVYETAHCYSLACRDLENKLKQAMHKAVSQANRRKKMLRIVDDYETCEILLDSICYITRDGRAVKIQAETARYTYSSLRSIAARLPDYFSRSHEGYIVNLKYLEEIRGKELTIKGREERIPIGRHYRQSFLDDYARFRMEQKGMLSAT